MCKTGKILHGQIQIFFTKKKNLTKKFVGHDGHDGHDGHASRDGNNGHDGHDGNYGFSCFFLVL